MGANAAIYLPHDDVDLGEVFEQAIVSSGSGGKVVGFDVRLGGERVRFNVMPALELSLHLKDFAKYIDSLDAPKGCKKDARGLVKHTRFVLGLEAMSEFDENPALWQSLFQIAGKWDGFVFAFNSVLLPNGGVIVGPLKEGG